MKSLFWLKEIRHNRKLTQEEVGKLIGSTREQYNAYENGRVDPQEFTKYKIAEALGFDVELWNERGRFKNVQ